MTQIKDLSDGTYYSGRTAETIARRVWGRKAKVVHSADRNAPAGRAMVVEDAPAAGGSIVHAHIVIYDN